MDLKKYSARAIMESLDNETVWEVLTGAFILVFDDGEEMITNWRETIISFYCWDLIRRHPRTQLLARHHIKSVVGTKTLKADHQLDLLSVISNDVWETYRDLNMISYDDFQGYELEERKFLVANYQVTAELIYGIVNETYNDVSYQIEPMVESIDGLDYLEFVLHPEVMRLKAELPNTAESAAEVNRYVEHLILKDPMYNENSIARGCRAATMKTPQSLQCVGVRGEQTDIDGEPFPCIIMAGFADGFLKLPYTAMESRSASRALNLASDDLKNTEYFSRRLQFQGQQVMRLVEGDCGSQHYLPFRVGEEYEDEEGNIKVTGKIGLYLGKNYLDPETGTLKTFTRKDGHLLGKTLMFRSPLWCMVEENNTICSCCFGELARGLPPLTNIGHDSTTDMTKQSSQGVLSTKHRQGNVNTKMLELTNGMGLLRASNDGYRIYLDKALHGSHVFIGVKKDQMKGILTILGKMSVSDMTPDFNPKLYSSIPRLYMTWYERKHRPGDSPQEDIVGIGDAKEGAYFSRKMIEYIMTHGAEPDNAGYMIVDLSDWNWDDEIICCQLRDFDVSEHAAEIADMLESKVTEMEDRDSLINPNVFVQEAFDTVNKKLNVPMSVIETIVYSLMIRSAEDYDYALPKPWTKRGIGVKRMTMLYRSFGPRMAYQEHREALMHPQSFLIENRPDHPMDSMLCPQEVLQANESYRPNKG